MRHTARKQAAHRTQQEADAEQRWTNHDAPEVTLLDQEIARHETTLDRAAAQFERRLAAALPASAHRGRAAMATNREAIGFRPEPTAIHHGGASL